MANVNTDGRRHNYMLYILCNYVKRQVYVISK